MLVDVKPTKASCYAIGFTGTYKRDQDLTDKEKRQISHRRKLKDVMVLKCKVKSDDVTQQLRVPP